ncbi:Crp/Fnr family transcriptional regulator [Chryseobacterium lathyri]|uniref:CRP-like cAMP-binding protein n=1 Tax=Chryseobacterium lathyri TaxID=395933 RepID=A0ABT9SK38_9FLAO|nr:Crp/Fnr family transcriptional regulator [Chryseobacterium lathyri]MDP9959668.1 CRP-like cAMP-binding protein [Chryseobacterium lathyri]MDQ0064758.1 CRP-like cAMP-binding protein [Chryseobacterium lathyri]
MKTISCMNIDEKVLYSYGGETKQYKKGEIIYREGDYSLYYLQIVEGKVKLNNYDEEGKEFIHNILGKNQSFGDSMLFLDKFYPMNAICINPLEIIRVPKDQFLKLIKTDPKLSLEMNACLSHRLYFKAIMIQNMASLNPASRLTGLLNYLKSYHDDSCGSCFHVQLTRQQIANLVGLRVETVIRALKKMEKEGSITIENRKIIY